MVSDTLSRYANLIRNISNWYVYFKRKFGIPYPSLQFLIRNRHIRFTTPTKSLYLVFKEIFINDVYNIRQMARQLPENPVVIDIGGNAGYFDLFLLSEKRQAVIYAYEAVAANCELFNKHLEMNPAIKNMVQVNHRAVTGTPRAYITLYLESSSSNAVTASIYDDFTEENTFTEQVPCVSLAEIFDGNNISRADLIKIDCEGSEYPIIYETPAEVWQKVRSMAIEVHDLDEEERNLRSLEQYLFAQGFNLSHEMMENDCHMLFATKDN